VKVTVVPGKLPVCALYPATWLKRVLLPQLGWPTRAKRNRDHSPGGEPWRARWRRMPGGVPAARSGSTWMPSATLRPRASVRPLTSIRTAPLNQPRRMTRTAAPGVSPKTRTRDSTAGSKPTTCASRCSSMSARVKLHLAAPRPTAAGARGGIVPCWRGPPTQEEGCASDSPQGRGALAPSTVCPGRAASALRPVRPAEILRRNA